MANSLQPRLRRSDNYARQKNENITSDILAQASNVLKKIWENFTNIFPAKNDQAIEVGRKHRPKYSIFILMLSLALIGVLITIMIAPAQNGDENIWKVILKQAFVLAGGIVLFVFASKMPLDTWRKTAIWFLAGAYFLSLVLAIGNLIGLPFASSVNGASRWLNFGFFTIQPSEFIKIATVLLTAAILYRASLSGRLNSISKTLLPLFAVIMISLIFVVIFQSDLSSGAVIVAIFLIQLIVAGVSWRNIAFSLLPFIGGVFLAILIAPYRLGRLMTFMGENPDQWDQISLSLMSLGSGGFFGKGVGQSVGAFGWVPEAANDAIFPIIGETFGYVGVIVILVIFCSLIIKIIDLVNYLPNLFMRLIPAGVFAWILSQTFINIGAMTRLIPVTGITLPFLSLGGSSLWALMLMMGVVFGISRYTSYRKVKLNQERAVNEDSLRRGRIRRTHYSSSRGH